MNNEAQLIFDLICSSSFKDISKGINKLNYLDNSVTVDNLFVLIKEIKNEEPKNIFLNFLSSRLFSKSALRIREKSFEYLVEFISDSSQYIEKQAKEYLGHFFETSDLPISFKLHCLKLVWSNLDSRKKVFFVKEIEENSIFQASPYLLDCLTSNNDELVVQSIKTLNVLKDKKAVRYIKRIMPVLSKDALLESIIAIGCLGSFFDAELLKKYFVEDDVKTCVLAIRSFRMIRKDYSIRTLLRMFHSVNDEKVKENIIKEISYIRTAKAGITLINLFQIVNDKAIKDLCKSCLYEIPELTRKKVFMKTFKNMSEDNKIGLMKHFSEFVDIDVFKLLKKYSLHVESPIYILSMLEVISFLDLKLIKPFVYPYTNDLDDPISYYSMDTLLRCRNVDVINLANDFAGRVTIKHIQHSIMIFDSIFKHQREEREIEANLESLYLDALASGNSNLQYSSIRSLRRVNNKRVRKTLFEIEFDLSNSDLVSEYIKTIGYCINHYDESFSHIAKSPKAFKKVIKSIKLSPSAFNEMLNLNFLKQDDLQFLIDNNRDNFGELLKSHAWKNIINLKDLVKSLTFNLKEDEVAFIVKDFASLSSIEHKRLALDLISKNKSERYSSFIIEQYTKLKHHQGLEGLKKYMELYDG